jgi:hypothetical protein
MLSALIMFRRFLYALRYAEEEEDFSRIIGAAALLVVVDTVALMLGEGWSVIDGFYVAVATLTTSSVLDPKLSVTEPWPKIFLALRARRDRDPRRSCASPRDGLHRVTRGNRSREGRGEGSEKHRRLSPNRSAGPTGVRHQFLSRPACAEAVPTNPSQDVSEGALLHPAARDVVRDVDGLVGARVRSPPTREALPVVAEFAAEA